MKRAAPPVAPKDLIIAASADWHMLASSPRFRTQEKVLFWMAEDAAKRGANLFVQAGDVFDKRTTEADRLFCRNVEQHYTQHFPLFLLGGNHDAELELGIHNSFASKYPIYVADDPMVKDVPVDGHVVRIAAMPDLRGAALAKRIAALAKTSSNKNVRAIDVARDVLEALSRGMRSAVGPRLFTAHLTVGGARMDNDQPARTVELSHSLAELGTVQAHAYVFGHIHLRQQWTIQNAPAFYTGSPYSNSYGDLAPKSYSLLRWTGSAFEVEVIPTPAPKLVLLMGTWRREGDVGEMNLTYAKEHETALFPVPSALAGAEVKLTYSVPLDDKDAAERAAHDHKLAIEQAGALKVDLDPIATVVARRRSTSVVRAKTTGDKVSAYWNSTKTTPDPERQERVLAHIARWESRLPTPTPVSQVHVESIAWEGVGTLRPAGRITFDQPGLHAIVGPNRAGKSTLLSLFSAGCWVKGSRGMVDRFTRVKSAHIETTLHTAHGTWEIRQDIGAKSCHVKNVYSGGREKYYDWAKKKLPRLEELERLSFLPSKKNGILDLYDTELKQALLQIAGSSHLVDLVQMARDDLREASLQRKVLVESLGRTPNPGPALSAAERDLTTANTNAQDLLAKHKLGGDLLRLLGEERRLLREQADTTEKLQRLAARRSELEAERANDMARLSTEASLEEVEETIREERARIVRLDAERVSVVAGIRDLVSQQERARSHARDERSRASRMKDQAGRIPECERAQALLPDAQAKLEQTTTAATQATKRASELNHEVALRDIRTIASNGRLKPSVRLQSAALLSIRDRADMVLSTTHDQEQLSTVLSARDAAFQAVADLQRLVDLLPTLRSQQQEQEAAEAAAEEEDGFAEMLDWRIRGEQEKLTSIDNERTDARENLYKAEEERTTLLADLAKHNEASQAKELLFVLQGQERAAEESKTTLAQRLEEICAQVKEHRSKWSGPPPTEETQRVLHQEVMQAQRSAARLEEVVRRQRELLKSYEADREKVNVLERHLGDLTEAVRVLDKNGTQAFEADAVGNEIAEEASDLLQQHGFRWTLRYDPLRQSTSKTDVEQARWMAYNLDTKEEYEAREIGGSSGGEEVVSGGAILFGVHAVVVGRGGGVKDAMLTLDERASAVRGDLVQSWLALLRDGASRVGITTILLVPPDDPQLVAACDGQIAVIPTTEGSEVRWIPRGGEAALTPADPMMSPTV